MELAAAIGLMMFAGLALAAVVAMAVDYCVRR